ncbi:MAG: radical SAM protein, partial [Candidatus Bathyarchaeota archaeon]
GLSRLHVGLETGDDELLKYVRKGVTSVEHILAGKKAKRAGFELSEYWMPGLGGKIMSEQHARNTARVLNKINPDCERSRRFVPRKGTPLYEEWKEGSLQLLSPHETLREILMMVENLEIAGQVCFDHFINPAYRIDSKLVWLFKQDYNGYKFPEEKPEVTSLAKSGLQIGQSRFIRVEDLIDMSL